MKALVRDLCPPLLWRALSTAKAWLRDGRPAAPRPVAVAVSDLSTTIPDKASDLLGRFRDIVSDPLNILIDRVPGAGAARDNEVVLHNGNRVPLTGLGSYYADFSNILIINRGVHEPLEEYVFQELLKILPSAPRMIELGAYWAHYSMWLKNSRPNATVTMIEPVPQNLAAGQANFARNGYDGEFIQALVGRGHWALDAHLQSRSIDHVHVLHADIQGLELEMLEDGAQSLRDFRVDYLFVSTHSQPLHRDVIAFLAGLGYRVEVSSDVDNDTTSFDGFVFASSPRAMALFAGFRHLGRSRIAASKPATILEYIIDVSRKGPA